MPRPLVGAARAPAARRPPVPVRAEHAVASSPKKLAIEGGSEVEFRYDGALQRTAMGNGRIR